MKTLMLLTFLFIGPLPRFSQLAITSDCKAEIKSGWVFFAAKMTQDRAWGTQNCNATCSNIMVVSDVKLISYESNPYDPTINLVSGEKFKFYKREFNDFKDANEPKSDNCCTNSINPYFGCLGTPFDCYFILNTDDDASFQRKKLIYDYEQKGFLIKYLTL